MSRNIVENRGPWSVSSPIQSPAQAPLLADGLFVHTAKPAEPLINREPRPPV